MFSAENGRVRGAFMYEFRYVKGHIEVYLEGIFQFSADSVSEAEEELARYERQRN